MFRGMTNGKLKHNKFTNFFNFFISEQCFRNTLERLKLFELNFETVKDEMLQFNYRRD